MQLTRWLCDTTRRRSVLLGAIIVFLSAFDMYTTMIYAANVGLYEANPIVHFAASYASITGLIVLKITSVGAALSIAFLIPSASRREFALWIMILIMVWLCFRWGAYTDTMDRTNIQINQDDPHVLYLPRSENDDIIIGDEHSTNIE